MYCKFCGGDIDDDSVFCRICGNKLTDGEPVPEQAAPVLSDEKTALDEQKTEILARLNENVSVENVSYSKPKPQEKHDEFYDVFAYWSGMSKLRKLALLFVFGAAALWAAMLVLTVFFP
ncbi:MAG: zinc ribbon domain-containing protein [Firmicutes bacterium]|nr:zinc ribbon domain-containing protein [Bacillota bacterium]